MKLVFWIILFIAIDQVSKYYFYNLHFLNSNIFIEPILNTGISWGIKIFHFNVLIILIPLILYVVYFLYKKNEISAVAFVFIFSGGISNFLDRIILHGVRDFINLPIFPPLGLFPIFNLADIFITIGFIIIFFNVLSD